MKANQLLVALSTVGLTLACGTVFANEDNIPLNDQVRFIGELESRSSDDWNFDTNESRFGEEAYLLQMSQPDVRLIEQDRSRWGNDGDGRNYSILVDVYNSDEKY